MTSAVTGVALAATLALGAGVAAWSSSHPDHGAVTAATATTTTAAATTDPDSQAASVVSTLGAVPIPTPRPESQVPPVARPGHPQLLAMGAPVEAKVPGADALVTALGPTQATTAASQAKGARPADSTLGTIDIRVDPRAGRLRLNAGDFSSRDETGAVVRLHPVGAASTSAAAQHGARRTASSGPQTLRLGGRFPTGSAQITWRHAGRVLAVWVFTVELD